MTGLASEQPEGRTTWSRRLRTPFRDFHRTESGSAGVLLAAAIAALVWANVGQSSYDSLWHTAFSVNLGEYSVADDLRGWVNSGLMTLFFFVVGLEARREFDVGELRERQRVTLPLLAGIGGMAVPVAIYLVFNAGRASAHGWGAAMSTDTAFALGMRCPPQPCGIAAPACRLSSRGMNGKNWRGPGGFAAEPPFDVSAGL